MRLAREIKELLSRNITRELTREVLVGYLSEVLVSNGGGYLGFTTRDLSNSASGRLSPANR